MSDSESVRHGRYLAQLKAPPIPKDWYSSKPGQFRSAWDFEEHKKIHEADKNAAILRDLPPADLREKLLPRLAAERLSLTHTKLFGLDSPSTIASLLLFFDSATIEICPLCLNKQTIPTAELLLAKGFIVPRLVTEYSAFKNRAFDMIQSYQEGIISSWANQAFLQVRSVGASEESWKRQNPDVCSVIDGMRKECDTLETPYKEAVTTALESFEIPLSPIMAPIVMDLQVGVKARDLPTIWRCISRANAVSRLEEDRAYENVPNFEVSDYQRIEPRIRNLFPNLRPTPTEALDLCAKGVHLAWTPDLPLKEYLNIVTSYRGKLRHFLSPSVNPAEAVREAISTVTTLNEEFESISRSRRYRWGSFSINLLRLPAMMKLLSYAAIGGGHVMDQLIANLAMARLPSVPPSDLGTSTSTASFSDQILSRYFQKDIRVVQLWRLRKSLTEAKNRKEVFSQLHEMNN